MCISTETADQSWRLVHVLDDTADAGRGCVLDASIDAADVRGG